jgi:hypothetical protein
LFGFGFNSRQTGKSNKEKMNESNLITDKLKDQRRFSQQQYDMLKRCSEKKDMTEWNQWRNHNPAQDILLEGADLVG